MHREETIDRAIERYRTTPGGLLPLFTDLQRDLGCLPTEAFARIARAFNLSRAEVHGVATFYEDFHLEPVGRHRLQVCCAEACQAMGANQLAEQASGALGIDFGETTVDGAVTLEAVYCLGNCACSPSIRLDEDVYARVDADRLTTLLAALPRGEDPS